jgi:hypothetical protein
MIIVSDTYVVTVHAQDDDSPTSDAGKIDYSINTGAFGKFVINPTSGEISGLDFQFTVTPAHEVTSIKQSPLLKGHFSHVLS